MKTLLIMNEKTIPERRAVYAELPARLNPEIADQGIKELYSHQAVMENIWKLLGLMQGFVIYF